MRVGVLMRIPRISDAMHFVCIQTNVVFIF